MKGHLKRFKIPLPKLNHEDESVFADDQHSIHSSSSEQSLKKKFLNLAKKTRYSSSNSDNLERYLRHCVDDPNIHSCSLFKEFLQPQRDEDNIVPKQTIQSIVQEQSMIESNILKKREIIGASGPTPPPDEECPSSVLSFTSITSRIEPIPRPPTISDGSDITASTDQTATIQDFQLIKVIGRGCMGKVSATLSGCTRNNNKPFNRSF